MIENDMIIPLQETSKKVITAATIYQSVEPLKLVHPDSKPLGEILKIEALKDNFLILYKYQDIGQNYISVFDRKGNFLYELIPSDENQYRYNPLDMDIIDADTFAVLEEYTGSLIYYSLDGKPIERKSLPLFYAKEFIYLSEKQEFVFHKARKTYDQEDVQYSYNVITTDSSFTVKQKYFPFSIQTGQRELMTIPFALRTQGDAVFFQKVLSDTIFKISETGIDTSQCIIFRTKTSDLDKENGQVGVSASIQEILNNGGVVVGGHYFVSNKNLYFQYAAIDHPGLGIYNLATGKLHTSSGVMTKDNIWVTIPLGQSSEGDYLYSYLNEFSVQYAPSSVFDNELTEEAVKDGDTYLLIIKEKNE